MDEKGDSVGPSNGLTATERVDQPDSDTDVVATALGVVGVAIGFWVTHQYVRQADVVSRLYDEQLANADLNVWLVLLGSIGALALAIALLSILWLVELARDSKALDQKTLWIWGVAVAVVVAAVIVTVIKSSGETGALNSSVGEATHMITIGVACCSLPGLLYFAALRSITNDDSFCRDETTSIGRLFLLRRLLFRQTALFGALLTLIVIATGIRRRTLLKIDEGRTELGGGEKLDIPIEEVLLYGLAFAGLLGLFYFLANSAMSTLSQSLVDEYAPIPDPDADDVGSKLELRVQVDSFISGAGPRHSFETSVVILSPLVTALIGTAIG